MNKTKIIYAENEGSDFSQIAVEIIHNKRRYAGYLPRAKRLTK